MADGAAQQWGGTAAPPAYPPTSAAPAPAYPPVSVTPVHPTSAAPAAPAAVAATPTVSAAAQQWGGAWAAWAAWGGSWPAAGAGWGGEAAPAAAAGGWGEPAARGGWTSGNTTYEPPPPETGPPPGGWKYSAETARSLMTSREWKLKWTDHCDRYHGGFYDPRRMSLQAVNEAIIACGEPPDEPSEAEVRRQMAKGWTADDVKKSGRINQEWKKKWEAYCDTRHRGFYDPGKLTAQELARAIAVVGDPPTRPSLFSGTSGLAPPPAPLAAAPRIQDVIVTRAQESERLGFNIGRDMKVQNCVPESPAGRAGIASHVGWTLLQINGREVTSLEAAAGYLKETRLVLRLREQTQDSLRKEYLEELAALPNQEAKRQAITARMKQAQGISPEWKSKWENYALTYGSGRFDPGQYTVDFLVESFRHIGVPPGGALKAPLRPLGLSARTLSRGGLSSGLVSGPVVPAPSDHRSRSRSRSRRGRSGSRSRDRRDRRDRRRRDRSRSGRRDRRRRSSRSRSPRRDRRRRSPSTPSRVPQETRVTL
eukprot:TRINITY_DN5403_c0_g7_i2.p1 TRINITY_DN5403_c0_g7~~TRINITY_DN5403_c0_g7_i2.p1  ORF type:complete len:565 (+),score=138.16 TRINITY_DN5403_c0_g7_i2:84-1697(+)